MKFQPLMNFQSILQPHPLNALISQYKELRTVENEKCTATPKEFLMSLQTTMKELEAKYEA